MSQDRTAILVGASGLVGGRCLELLCADATYTEVLVITRRRLGGTAEHRKVSQLVVDFGRLDDWTAEIIGDDVFCAFGTTIKKAGSRERFREIDLEYPAHIAKIARKNGARHLSLVSSRGADPGSRIFYLRIKGRLEQTVRDQQWPGLAILRPSVIGGERNESRFGERIAQWLGRLAPPSVRTVPAIAIARMMIRMARDRQPGVHIVESKEILRG